MAQTKKFKPPTMNQVLARIKHIQTGDLQNPFIRTRFIPASGSAAFGPYQMSQMLLNDLNMDLIPQKHRAQASTHLDALRKQRQLFLRHGVNPSHIARTGIDPRKQKDWKASYDYGGTGASIKGQNVFGMKNQAYIHDLIAKNYLSKVYQRAVKNATNQDQFYYLIANGWHGSKQYANNVNYGKKLKGIASDTVQRHLKSINDRELKYQNVDPQLQFSVHRNTTTNPSTTNTTTPPAKTQKNTPKIYKPNYSQFSAYNAQLKRLNPGINFKNLKIGTKLKLPGNRSIIVSKGFTGWNDWRNNYKWGQK